MFYVISQLNAWCIFADMRSALKALACSLKHSINHQLILKNTVFSKRLRLVVTLRGCPSRCEIRGHVLLLLLFISIVPLLVYHLQEPVL